MSATLKFPAFSVSFAVLVLGVPFPTQAELNDTGQTRCYSATDMVDPACSVTTSGDAAARPRQDGRFGRDWAEFHGALNKTGAGEAGFDYTKISNAGNALPAVAALGANPGDWACTRDNVTGLVWEAKTDDSGPRDKDHTYTWYDSAAANPGSQGNAASCGNTLGGADCNTENYRAAMNIAHLCGHDDWRLPTARELLSLVHNGRRNPAIDPDYFPNTVSSWYWSTETHAAGQASAWGVDFFDGNVGFVSKTYAYRVRLVRGTVLPAAAFVNNNDGTVSDTTTGLMWMKCSRGQSGAACATGAATTFGWATALREANVANAANELGYNDWRLPNKNELESLVDRARTNPAINPVAFPNTVSDWYWSSTTLVSAAGFAWVVGFNDGIVGYDIKTSGLRVRLVRGGQWFEFDRLLPATGAVTPTGAGAGFSATLAAWPPGVVATGYWLVRAAGDAAPTPEELRLGTGPVIAGAAGATGINDSGGIFASGQTQSFAVPGLPTDGGPYALYYAAQDGNGNMNLIRKTVFWMKGGVATLPTPPSSAAIPALKGAALAALAGLALLLGAAGLAVRRSRR